MLNYSSDEQVIHLTMMAYSVVVVNCNMNILSMEYFMFYYENLCVIRCDHFTYNFNNIHTPMSTTHHLHDVPVYYFLWIIFTDEKGGKFSFFFCRK